MDFFSNLPKLRQSKVLITGHSGFKGSWLISLLNNLGIETLGISLNPSVDPKFLHAQLPKNQSEIFGDIRNLDFLKISLDNFGPDVVIHLAAQSLVLAGYEDPINTFSTNVMGTANILDAALSNGNVKVVAIITTDKVYENQSAGTRFKESDSLGADDPYSSSKVATVSVIRSWRRISQNFNGGKVLEFRAGNVIGGGDNAENRLLPDLIRAYSSGNQVEIRNPSSTRPWQHVLDPLFGYLLAIEAHLNAESQLSETFNFGPSESSLTVSEVVQIVQEELSGLPEVSWIKSTQAPFKEMQNLELDSTLASESLDWIPTWTQAKAVKSTVDWWKRFLNGNESIIEAMNHDIQKLMHNYSPENTGNRNK
jgi:CDP-glucose 4,6-dehydratase